MDLMAVIAARDVVGGAMADQTAMAITALQTVPKREPVMVAFVWSQITNPATGTNSVVSINFAGGTGSTQQGATNENFATAVNLTEPKFSLFVTQLTNADRNGITPQYRTNSGGVGTLLQAASLVLMLG